MGGGWSIIPADQPRPMALAVKLGVPWDRANHPLDLRIELLTEDGKQVPGPDGKPLLLEGKLEVGRPPGLKPGTTLDAALAVNAGGLQFADGGYEWRVSVGEDDQKSISFLARGGGA